MHGRYPPTHRVLAVLLALTAVLLTGTVAAGIERADPPREPVFVRIYYDEIGDLSQLTAYDLFEYNNLEDHYVHAAVSDRELRELRNSGWLVVAERLAWMDYAPNSYYGGYRTVDELYTDMAQLVSRYPSLSELVSYGRSYCKTQDGCETPGGEQTPGYELLAVRVTNEDVPGASVIGETTRLRGEKPLLFILANIHGRELTTPEIAVRWLAQLLEEYGSDPDITWLVDWHEMWIIPTANPDGHWITELGTSSPYNGAPFMHRKNFDQDADGDGAADCTVWPSKTYSQTGVDLNRNHSFSWLPPSAETSACEQTYSGPFAASEPEVAALQELISALFADRRGSALEDPAPEDTSGLLFTLHNYGDLIMRPWAYSGDPPPNEAGLKAIGDKLGILSGYQSCRSPECLYFAHGTTDDWAYGELGMAAFTFEIGSSDQGFSPPYTVIDEDQWPDNRAAFLYAARIARAPYQLIHGPVVTSLAINVDESGKARVVAMLNDRHHGGQVVTSAEYSLDHPFWSMQASPHAMVHVGNSTATQEEFSAELDTSGLAPGQHIIFVRGKDVDGNTGATSSAFFMASGWEFTYIPIAVGR